jgi:hypothetical protein
MELKLILSGILEVNALINISFELFTQVGKRYEE